MLFFCTADGIVDALLDLVGIIRRHFRHLVCDLCRSQGYDFGYAPCDVRRKIRRYGPGDAGCNVSRSGRHGNGHCRCDVRRKFRRYGGGEYLIRRRQALVIFAHLYLRR